MTPGAHIPTLAAAAALAVGATGCGNTDEGDPIPRGKATAMAQQLDAVQAAVDNERCDDIPSLVSDLQGTIRTLDNDGVGEDVQDALSDGADNLRSVARQDCEPEEEPVETTPETVPTTPPTTETVPPVTETEEEPVPPPEEELPPPPEEEPEPPIEEPPDEGDGEGQFDPEGGGVGPEGGGPPGQLKKGEG